MAIKIWETQNGLYQGMLIERQREGMGTFLWDNGDLYLGEWRSNQMHGQGVLFFSYGGFVKGQFSRGKLDGPGLLKFPNDVYYEGFWRGGRLHGKCFKYFKEGAQYLICQYDEGILQKVLKKFALESYQSPDKQLDKYFQSLQRQVDDDQQCALTYAQFRDGGHYVGSVKHSVPEGLGRFCYPDGKSDCGIYQNGLLNGLGKMNFPNGDTYDGQLKSGQFEGEGVYYSKDNNAHVYGIFKKNHLYNVQQRGSGFPTETLEILKYHAHALSHYYIDENVEKNVLEIPKFNRREHNTSLLPLSSTCADQYSTLKSETSFVSEKSVYENNSRLEESSILQTSMSSRQQMSGTQYDKQKFERDHSFLYQLLLSDNDNVVKENDLSKSSTTKVNTTKVNTTESDKENIQSFRAEKQQQNVVLQGNIYALQAQNSNKQGENVKKTCNNEQQQSNTRQPIPITLQTLEMIIEKQEEEDDQLQTPRQPPFQELNNMTSILKQNLRNYYLHKELAVGKNILPTQRLSNKKRASARY